MWLRIALRVTPVIAHPPVFLYVWQGKELAARCLYVWQGKELFAQKWCKIRGYSDVWQRQDLAWVTGDSKT